MVWSTEEAERKCRSESLSVQKKDLRTAAAPT